MGERIDLCAVYYFALRIDHVEEVFL